MRNSLKHKSYLYEEIKELSREMKKASPRIHSGVNNVDEIIFIFGENVSLTECVMEAEEREKWI